MSVKGYATLPPNGGGGGDAAAAAGWTRRAETVRLESETSSTVPRSRRSLEAFGELLEGKALSAWGARRGDGGRLEALARYTWERLLYDGRILDVGEGEGRGDGGGAGDGVGWQVCAKRMCACV